VWIVDAGLSRKNDPACTNELALQYGGIELSATSQHTSDDNDEQNNNFKDAQSLCWLSTVSVEGTNMVFDTNIHDKYTQSWRKAM